MHEAADAAHHVAHDGVDVLHLVERGHPAEEALHGHAVVADGEAPVERR